MARMARLLSGNNYESSSLLTVWVAIECPDCHSTEVTKHVEPLPRFEIVGFRHQTGIAVSDCLTSPTPMVELPTILILMLAFLSRSFSDSHDGQHQRRTDKSRDSKT